jgi:cellulose synthase/poly-beta-1,6-N-acetylglucosamine synthase-like glycosyltransferase
MAGVHQGPKGAPAPLRGGAPQTYFDRRVHRREGPDTRAAVLPPELGFIAAGHGVSPQRLLAALETAPHGVRPLDAVLKEGILPEDVYYRALARHLGCEYYSGDQPFGPGFDAVKSLQTGVAPLYGGGRSARAVIAPGARSVSGLIEMTASGRLHPTSFALTSPQHFASFVRTQRGEAILAEALERLEAKWSAKGGMSGGQIAAAGLVAALAIGLGVANLQTLAASLAVLSWAIFLTSIVLRSMATVADGATPRPRRLTDDECPLYTIVAPVYREVEVVDDLIKALDALDYPKSKLDIKLVVEQRDRETLSRILGLRLPARYEVIVAPPGEPSTKPRALNIALSTARGELLTVYDAEDEPAPDQLRLAASRFASETDLDCLQARLAVRNTDDSWLSRLFAIEYAVLFDLINPGLSGLELPIALGGTSNHFRIESLLDVGGWDQWNVAEDADLGIRLARCGYKVGSLESTTSEEAPHELENWFRQRVRWQKGWLQTFIVHSREPSAFVRDLGARRAAAAAILIFGSVASALFWPVFALDTLRRAVVAGSGDMSAWREASDVFTYSLALAGIWAMVIPAIVAARQRRCSEGILKSLALMPAYYLLVSAAAWTAIIDVAVRPHYWAKTAHGRTRGRSGDLRQTRPAAPQAVAD